MGQGRATAGQKSFSPRKGRPLPRLCYSSSAAALLLVVRAPSGLWQRALPWLHSSAVEGGEERREEEKEAQCWAPRATELSGQHVGGLVEPGPCTWRPAVSEGHRAAPRGQWNPGQEACLGRGKPWGAAFRLVAWLCPSSAQVPEPFVQHLLVTAAGGS